uniref:Potassium channel subfamily K member 1 n=1 Tax=Leptobrachium leishanense TaxID=445787 RepID=A0A8C5MH32_9ANUR
MLSSSLLQLFPQRNRIGVTFIVPFIQTWFTDSLAKPRLKPYLAGRGEADVTTRSCHIRCHRGSVTWRQGRARLPSDFAPWQPYTGASQGSCHTRAEVMLQSLSCRTCIRITDKSRPTWCFGILISVYLLFLVLGAVVFMAVEQPNEQTLRRDLLELKRQFLQQYPCLPEDRLEALLSKVLIASDYGVSVLNNVTGHWNWDYTSSLFFVTTVLSTTGYGHTVPLSDGGKIFCILYSLIGIPLTLIFLTAIVQRILIHVTHQPVTYIHIRWGYSKAAVAICHALCLGFLTFLCFFIIPAVIFSSIEEDWNFLESFYFCIISLSTIGLGDYVPGEGYNQKLRYLYKFGTTCYLLLGLVAMLIVLETFCELPQLTSFRKMFYMKRKKYEDRVNLAEEDQLAFSSISGHVVPLKEQDINETFVALQPFASNAENGSANHEQ